MASLRVHLVVCAVLGWAIASPVRAQTPLPPPAPAATAPPAPCAPTIPPPELVLPPSESQGPAGTVTLPNDSGSPPPNMLPPAGPPVGQENWVGQAGPGAAAEGSGWEGHWYAGADFLYVRTHFSEATAFVRGSQDDTSYHTSAQALDFQYSPSFRVFAGYQFEGTDTELRFTYTRFNAQTEDDAGNFTAGHFAVDPFGNVAGVAVVVDPSSAEFGHPIVGGDRIQASAVADVNVFDLDVIKPLLWVCGGWQLKYTAGVRIAQVHEYYQSIITDSGSFFSGGVYSADFTGAGPRLGFQAQRYFGACRQFSLFASSYASLLVGEYDQHFGQSTASPVFQATQDTNEVRVLPVAEAELGAGWSPIPWFNVSAGWLFQAWFDLGGSGGNFGGFYTVTENSNIMAFDGFFLRAAVTF